MQSAARTIKYRPRSGDETNWSRTVRNFLLLPVDFPKVSALIQAIFTISRELCFWEREVLVQDGFLNKKTVCTYSYMDSIEGGGGGGGQMRGGPNRATTKHEVISRQLDNFPQHRNQDIAPISLPLSLIPNLSWNVICLKPIPIVFSSPKQCNDKHRPSTTLTNHKSAFMQVARRLHR